MNCLSGLNFSFLFQLNTVTNVSLYIMKVFLSGKDVVLSFLIEGKGASEGGGLFWPFQCRTVFPFVKKNNFRDDGTTRGVSLVRRFACRQVAARRGFPPSSVNSPFSTNLSKNPRRAGRLLGRSLPAA